MPTKQKLYASTCRKANAKFNTRKAMESYISGFHYKATIGPRI